MLLYWKQRLSVLTAKEPQVQIQWDLSRPLEQNLIPQQQWLCFESPLAEELEGKLSVPNGPGSSPKGWLILLLLWSAGRNRHYRTGSSAPRNRTESSCPEWHGKCQHGACHGAGVPTGAWWKSWHEGLCVAEVLWFSFHRGTAAGQHFLPQIHLLACKAGQLCGLWKGTASCEPSPTCHPLAQALWQLVVS